MGTPFLNIIERAHITLRQDYRLDKLYVDNPTSYTEFMVGFLENSISMFDGCLSDLSYSINNGSYYFDKELTPKEQYLLSLGIAIGLYKRDLDDVTQYKLHLSNKAFKTFSEQANISKRLERLNALEEELSQEITNYQLHNIEKIPFFGN